MRIVGEADSMERKLKHQFRSNQLMKGIGNPYFPEHCLGAGCAEWATDSVRAFADAFFSRVGCEAYYQKHRLSAG
jgi:hypothetical protein